MFNYSVTQWIFGDESLEDSLKRLQKYGYQGVELAGEPDSIDIDSTKKLLRKYDLACSSICGIFNPERDLSSSDASIRKNGIEYVKKCINLAKSLHASTVIVVPTFVGKVNPDTNVTEEWQNAISSVKEVGLYAKDNDITIVIEALNRYETYLVSNLTLALKFVEEADVESVKMMADLFHMSIEERDMIKILSKISRHLAHVHIADNTREAAGLGQTDFKPVISFLKDINYNGYITMEFLPAVSNPYLASELHGESNIFDDFTRQSIQHMKKIA
ncbi:sugar phosphate isomerase/epimerase [Peribacillus cavernae]|uniref:Sugar phosphate isomerase/epimerase n=1 Tax=Peribacillus cavernae TaxID=1674310 RepID=A0A3S0U4Y2_9BACI|nr:sugar phosphate isomerase/epimerase family protein [Peribacillus cavernae]MDQ0217417.1 sugar phosphate isomerase/epimerase [Peribacillus cavernae]RUQ30135.1 sugar phosphate isomerase/epimerase [Peribacillus cavernae]